METERGGKVWRCGKCACQSLYRKFIIRERVHEGMVFRKERKLVWRVEIRAGFGRILCMEIGNEFLCVSEGVGRNPVGFFSGSFVTLPPDQVAERAILEPSVVPGIQDFGNLEFWFSVVDYRRQRWLNATGNGVRGCGFELGHVVYRVNAPEGIRELEGKG